MKVTYNKKIINIIIIVLLNSLIGFSQTSGWDNKGTYLEEKQSISPITILKYDKNKNQIFTNSIDSIIRVWDYNTGEYIKQWTKPHPSFDINTSNESFVDGTIEGDFFRPSFPIIDLNTDTIIKSDTLSEAYHYLNTYSPTHICFLNYSGNYKYILAAGETQPYYMGSDYSIIENGQINVFDVSNGNIFKVLSDYGAIDGAAISPDENNFAYSAHNHYKMWHDIGEGYEYYNYFIDSNLLYHELLDYNGEKLKNKFHFLKISSNNKILIANNDSYYLWNLDNYKLFSNFTIKSDSLNILRQSIYSLSDDSKKIILSNNYYNPNNTSQYSIIQIRDIYGNILKDSVFALENYFIEQIVWINGTSKFLTGSTDGKIRLFDFNDFTNIDEIKKYDISLSIFYNKTFDYIVFPDCITDETIVSFYSIYGDKVIETKSLNHTILIDKLFDGVYFFSLNISNKNYNGKIAVIR
jgi:hypothetical protein